MQIQVLDFREIFIITQLFVRRDNVLQLRVGTRILTNSWLSQYRIINMMASRRLRNII